MVTLRNLGNVNISYSQTSVLISNNAIQHDIPVYYEETKHLDVPVGSSQWLEFSWDSPVAGRFGAMMKLSSSNIILDILTVSFTVTTIDFPDLSVSDSEIILSDLNPTEGEHSTITATVHNIGTQSIGQVTVRFYADAVQIGADQFIQLLPQGGSQQVQIDWQCSRGPQTLRVVVDPENEVQELNESNNAAARSIIVSISGGPAASDYGWLWIVGIVVAAIIVCLIAFFRRRRSARLPR